MECALLFQAKLPLLLFVAFAFLFARMSAEAGETVRFSELDAGGKSAAPLATPVALPFEQVLPGRVTEYEALTAHGEWGKEYLLRSEILGEKGFRYVQKAGRSCQGLKPWLMVRHLKTGQGLAVSLAYSGNWILEVQPRGDQTVVRAAASPASLKPFATFNGLPVPGALLAEFTGHWDYGAQPIVRFIRAKLRREMGPDWPPVQYNHWYATSEKLSEPFLLDAARAAAEVGCELFTVDSGWYGKDAKADWNYLGEWEVNRERLPHGLEAVASEARKLGMKFGLWVEIECVTPNSPLGKEHPDWFLRDGERLLSGRGVLNFGHPPARAWAQSVLDRLVTTYRLDYLKMDFNTDPSLDSERFAGGDDPLCGHYRGLMELWKHLRDRYPQLVVENCSSGSLRQDLMTAALTDTHWVSDNVENRMNLAMNLAATYFFPPEICNHWTTSPVRPAQNDAGPGSALDLESQFTANMLGHLGLSGRIDHWDAETRRVVAERIALYKRIRPLLRNADVFHLTPPWNGAAPLSVHAALYVDATSRKALLFAFQGGAPALEATFHLRGLPPEPRYRLRMPPAFGPEQVLAGTELVEKGLPVRFPHRGAAAVIEIEPGPERP